MALQESQATKEADTIRDAQFKTLVDAVSQLQSLGISDEIQDDTKEDIQFDITQEKLKLQRNVNPAPASLSFWLYHVNSVNHGPFTSVQIS